jgi:L-threonylcarbamoyladenylate synthase
MPTETQYALSLRADQSGAVTMIRRIKRRDTAMTSALFVRKFEDAEKFCSSTLLARKIADRFLPGPLTLVLPPLQDQQAIPEDFVSERGIGIRVSSSPLVQAVMEEVGFPVTATSANISGELTSRTIDTIRAALGDLVDLYVDGGPCGGVTPSTVVHVNDTATLLRHGVISEAEIETVVGGGTA